MHERIAMRWAAEAAIQRGIMALVDPPPGREPGTNSPQRFEIAGYDIELRTLSETGKINLNRSEAALLSAAFAATGTHEADAQAIADAIIDWRDTDQLPSPFGAEHIQYRQAGYTYGPRNGPFETVGELVQVKGVTDVSFDCLAQVFTVYSNSSAVDTDHASDLIKDILAWARLRQWQGQTWTSQGSGASVLNPFRQRGGMVYEIRATARGAIVREVTLAVHIRLTDNPDNPFDVLSWREMYADNSQTNCEITPASPQTSAAMGAKP